MYNIKVNDKFDLTVENKGGKLLINDSITDADIKQLAPSVYHIINDLKSYNAEIVSFDREAKTAEIKINGNNYTIKAKDQYDILLEKLGLNNLNSAKISEIKAPMPGLVLKVFVLEGTAVQKGDNLFVLEAMKMENIIKSPADVVVKAVKIKPGDKVEKGQVLIKF
jgi:biotin carboxyl carrier protein